jgi:uncharacterized DUF497 family protein
MDRPVGLIFEWDARKAAANRRAHRVSFAEAATVFGDPLSLTIADPEHSLIEERFVDIGASQSGRILAVAYVERRGRIRIISARAATRREKQVYEEGR